MLSPISSDCKEAMAISIQGNTVYGPTAPPVGYGDKQEIVSLNKTLFEKEHNSAWYILTIERDGELVFEIVPTNPKDDYDFLLYNYNPSFCEAFSKNTITPFRTNLSRVDESIRGITGLMANVKTTVVGKGIGNAYSKSVAVKKGEKYILVIDNVHDNGSGHTLYFNYLKEVEIKGKVFDSNNKPLEADVVLSDNFGNTVEKTKSNANGEYDFKTSIKENENYNLITSSERTFIQNTKLNTSALKNTTTFSNSKTVLPILKVGAKYNFGNINFYGNLPDLLPCSYPSADALVQLMEKNRKLVIQIEGHVNKGVIKSKEDDLFNQQLSEERAKTIFNYLVGKGISKDRLSIVGLSANQMIFPKPKTEIEQEANRRVEIKITSME
jgi:outer membrane protein OmpA-like peptidoglycan-associated protein